ncbi:hypothetical protein ACJ41O_011782 [Fusarium nematophilum]
MDFIKSAISGGKKQETKKAEGSKDGKDFLDKGIAFASKKAGFHISPQNNERIGDAARSAYEKQTGKKVDPKISN